MLTPQKPDTEEARLKELYSFHLLDTESEQTFDDIVRIASFVTGSPVALVSLVDRERQWFKAHVGIDAKETPRDISFCGHAILSDELFEVPDALKDHRFHDNPLVTDFPSIRFYAGQPLITTNGHRVGTLCSIDTKPKTLTPEQRQMLKSLARQVVILFERRVREIRLAEVVAKLENEQIMRERFVNAMTHDLKTPLTSAKMSAQLLSRLTQGQEKLTVLTQRIDRALNRSEDMINNILDAGKISSGEKLDLNFERFNLTEELMVAIAELETIHGSKLILQNADSELWINGHAKSIFRIIDNLINNAVKYGKSSESVTISLKKKNRSAHLSVHNHGEPISEDYQQDMFKVFTRSSSAIAGSQKGWGLGLTIVKGITEVHQGSIHIDSSAEQGTTFTVILPLV